MTYTTVINIFKAFNNWGFSTKLKIARETNGKQLFLNRFQRAEKVVKLNRSAWMEFITNKRK